MLLSLSVLLLLVNSFAFSEHIRYKRQGESRCVNPNNRPGVCKGIKECPELIELLKKANRDPEIANFLRRSRCGMYAEVCCPVTEEGDTNTQENEGQCGKSAVRQSNRVVGGQPADLGAWPWIAALGYKQRSSRNPKIMWSCGGSLINKRYILTAAHCINTPPETGLELTTVRLGEHNLNNDSDGATPIDYGIDRTIVHPNYRSRTNDIALIRLDRSVTYTDKIRPICLPNIPSLRSSNYERKVPFVVGWGETNLNGPSSDVLLQVQVPIVDNESCGSAYSRFGATITDKHLCAGEKNGGKDSCRGDSGGPLMLPDTGKYYQIGIISFGYRCAEPGFAGVYTRVTSYLDWIKSNANNL